MLAGVIPATHKALERSGLTIDDIDSYEVNQCRWPEPRSSTPILPG
jgi:acetyl-CoA acyltransferase